MGILTPQGTAKTGIPPAQGNPASAPLVLVIDSFSPGAGGMGTTVTFTVSGLTGWTLQGVSSVGSDAWINPIKVSDTSVTAVAPATPGVFTLRISYDATSVDTATTFQLTP